MPYQVLVPEIAVLRLAVMDEGVFGEPFALAYAALPVSCIRPGLRCIPLCNGLGDPLDMASVLVRIAIAARETPVPLPIDAIVISNTSSARPTDAAPIVASSEQRYAAALMLLVWSNQACA